MSRFFWPPFSLLTPPRRYRRAIYLYSNLFSDAFGLSVLAPASKAITVALKNTAVGANYSPLEYSPYGYTQFQYWYPVNKAITIFRKGALTLPWVSLQSLLSAFASLVD